MHEIIKDGDIVTFAGKYKRRTFWEWLTRKPRQLQRFRFVVPPPEHVNCRCVVSPQFITDAPAEGDR